MASLDGSLKCLTEKKFRIFLCGIFCYYKIKKGPKPAKAKIPFLKNIELCKTDFVYIQ